MYNKDLLKKPAMLLVNKMDSEGAAEKYRDLKPNLVDLEKTFNSLADDIRPEMPIKFDEILRISAKTEPGDVEIVKERLRRLLDCYAEQEQENVDNSDIYNKMSDLVRERGPKLI